LCHGNFKQLFNTYLPTYVFCMDICYSHLICDFPICSANACDFSKRCL
jgi:hypothetical protein